MENHTNRSLPVIGSIAVTALLVGGVLTYTINERISRLENHVLSISNELETRTTSSADGISKSPWVLTFDLPEGWRYAGLADYESPIPAEEKITKSSNYVLLTNSTKPFVLGGRAPDWSNGTNISDGVAVQITPVPGYPHMAKEFTVVQNLLKSDLLESADCKKMKAGESVVNPEIACGGMGVSNLSYWFRVNDEWYRADVYGQNKVFTAEIEQMLSSAK